MTYHHTEHTKPFIKKSSSSSSASEFELSTFTWDAFFVAMGDALGDDTTTKDTEYLFEIPEPKKDHVNMVQAITWHLRYLSQNHHTDTALEMEASRVINITIDAIPDANYYDSKEAGFPTGEFIQAQELQLSILDLFYIENTSARDVARSYVMRGLVKSSDYNSDQTVVTLFSKMTARFNRDAHRIAELIGSAHSVDCLVALMRLQESYQKAYETIKNDPQVKAGKWNVTKPMSMRSILKTALENAKEPKDDQAQNRKDALDAYRTTLEIEAKDSWIEKFITCCEFFEKHRSKIEWLYENTYKAFPGYTKAMKKEAVAYLQATQISDASWIDTYKQDFVKAAGYKYEDPGNESNKNIVKADGEPGKPIPDTDFLKQAENKLKRVKEAAEQGLLGKLNKATARKKA